jgi:thiol:disulfide interchange protein
MKMGLKISLGIALLLVIVTALGAITRRENRREERREALGQNLNGLIPWRSDLDSATKDAAAANKPLMVEFVASWCPDCHEMAKETWTQPSIAEAMKAYMPVLIDVDARPELARQYHVVAIPSLFILDPKSGKVVREVRDRVLSPDQLLAWLN